MSPAARSIYYFGFYLYVLGITLIFAPNFLLSAFSMEVTSEVWIHVVGVLVFNIGLYYNRSGANNDVAFCRLTVPARIIVFVAFVVFAALEYVSPVIILFGSVDLASAIWTWVALRKERALPA